MNLGRQLSRLAALLFPPACPLCSRTFPAGWNEPFCGACLDGFLPLPDAHCPRCVLPYKTESGSLHLCERCLRSTPLYTTVHAVGLYEQNLRRAVHHFKFNQRVGLDRPLGQLLLRRLPADIAFDLIVPVPLHPQRLRERSYNQSLLLAREIGSRLKVPVDVGLLQRTRDTGPQRQLPAKARETNLRGAFQVREQLTGERVLLIDDVMTTGATVSACSKALWHAGAREIQVGVVGRAAIL